MQFFPKIWSKEKQDTSLSHVLKDILGFTPRDKTLYQTAFTHRSVSLKNKEGGYINFERLEFLGDTVIETVGLIFFTVNSIKIMRGNSPK